MSADGVPLWKDSFSVNDDALVSVEKSVATRIATAFKLDLSEGERERIVRPQDTNRAAYEVIEGAYGPAAAPWRRRGSSRPRVP